MKNNAQNLFWKIINCGQGNCPADGCNPIDIKNLQRMANVKGYQIPEPWNGDIENAEILFVGINPGLNPAENYPETDDPFWASSTDTSLLDSSKVEDFFENRFDNNRPSPYVKVKYNEKPSFSLLLKDGGRKNVNYYWRYVYNIAASILKRKVTPGVDYALTEIVHCKTKSAKDIYKCICPCVQNFLCETISAAKTMRFMVVVGAKSRESVSKLLGQSKPENYKWYSIKWNDRDIKVLYVPHNAARGKKQDIPSL